MENEDEFQNEDLQEQEDGIPFAGEGAVAVETEIPRTTEEARAYAEQTAEAEKQQAALEEQDKKLLAALDAVLEKRTQRIQEEEQRSQTKARRLGIAAVKKGVGFISLGFVLIFLGVAMIICLFSPSPDFMTVLKLSPICAVLVGIEILLNQVFAKGSFRVNIPSLIISALLVAGCCVMCVSLNKTYEQETVEYNNRSIAGEIYNRSYNKLKDIADIASVTVDVNLNPNGSGRFKGVDALSADDYIDITINFAGTYKAPEDFAADCKKIIDGYRDMKINVTNFHFLNESKFSRFSLNAEGRYIQDYSESRLKELVKYIYISEHGYLEDLEDFEEFEEESENSSETD